MQPLTHYWFPPMYPFDLTLDPPTGKELDSVMSELKQHRRKLMFRSCLSDGIHILLLLLLYFGHFLSGPAILVLIALSLVIAIILATSTRESLLFSDLIAIAVTIITTAAASTLLLAISMNQPWGASMIAGLLAATIVTSGTILGRELKKIMFAIEQLTSIPDDDPVVEEVNFFCQRYPDLRHYREQASRNLRPRLTYGELFAMRDWHQQQMNGER
ncbi:hypothetical protein [Pelovirga terrestris]|uniref:Uncharacterized protein n=1 Tax=Pelovirga terrestris TaxID=2771352 RepID=A0A8J6QP86_9BACT|nr:hypothetical protein [Pelovirga terrestris]MBD1399250.1 hypothetical protein [Pelovirga terrestris]